MDRLHRAIKNVHRLDDLAARGTALTRLPPLPKLLAAVVYLAVTLSFSLSVCDPIVPKIRLDWAAGHGAVADTAV